jgi:hypothetical protein
MEAAMEFEKNEAEKEDCQTPDLMLSLEMMNIHLDRTQGRKGGSAGQEEQEVAGEGACHYAQEEGQGSVGQVAMGSLWSLPHPTILTICEWGNHTITHINITNPRPKMQHAWLESRLPLQAEGLQ